MVGARHCPCREPERNRLPRKNGQSIGAESIHPSQFLQLAPRCDLFTLKSILRLAF